MWKEIEDTDGYDGYEVSISIAFGGHGTPLRSSTGAPPPNPTQKGPPGALTTPGAKKGPRWPSSHKELAISGACRAQPEFGFRGPTPKYRPKTFNFKSHGQHHKLQVSTLLYFPILIHNMAQPYPSGDNTIRHEMLRLVIVALRIDRCR